MIALDGISMSSFASSSDLRSLMAKAGHTIPKSANDIRNMVMDYANDIREMYSKEMQDALANGELLSLTMDEWTSLSNKKYMNVNVHSANGRVWGLGMARVFGSAPADKCRKIMEDLLTEFNLTLDNIASVTTDGATVMKKMGREIGPEHQVCFAHGLHLAVCDILYKKTRNQLDRVEENIVNDEEAVEDLQDAFAVIPNVLDTFDDELTTTDDVAALIKKVRKTVVIFKNSACKNDDIFTKFLEAGDKRTLIQDARKGRISKPNGIFLKSIMYGEST